MMTSRTTRAHFAHQSAQAGALHPALIAELPEMKTVRGDRVPTGFCAVPPRGSVRVATGSDTPYRRGGLMAGLLRRRSSRIGSRTRSAGRHRAVRA